ncbi:diguanylate cyclase [Noviherbaspirillum sp. CPCC 100848]|uniref:Diguanylate cyclase n=1 Tax=Noviherbaspirillum album TaxID=3080276 RepID=A0ABU6J298_9BURK|nr:diguanylate cyclase [Noviherbaspirillum sp. CPCC 100848]MEC4717546.1 diguanylate cyclase [Noviherbaspirillum sp. CPCC 100848]
MTLPNLMVNSILYFFIPLWIIVGFGDWLFHRITKISETSGVKESLLHLLMLSEIGIPLLMGLFLEINALVLGIMLIGFLAHEATVLWDLRYAVDKRTILPGEQVIHSFQELLPLMMLVLLVFLHWEQFVALVSMNGQADFQLRMKENPLPPSYLAGVIAGAGLLIALPYMEEFWRCYSASDRRRVVMNKPAERLMPGRDA